MNSDLGNPFSRIGDPPNEWLFDLAHIVSTYGDNNCINYTVAARKKSDVQGVAQPDGAAPSSKNIPQNVPKNVPRNIPQNIPQNVQQKNVPKKNAGRNKGTKNSM